MQLFAAHIVRFFSSLAELRPDLCLTPSLHQVSEAALYPAIVLQACAAMYASSVFQLRATHIYEYLCNMCNICNMCVYILYADPNRVYDPRVSKWHSLKQHPSEMHSAKHRLVEEVRDYCRGVFYLPHVSDSGTRKLRGRIYSLFRHPLTGHDTVLTRLSIAYLAIRYLSKCTYLGDALVTRSIAPRAVYASITIAPRSHRIGRGAIVLAHPMLLNSGFTQSVVLLVYRSDASLLGLVLNRTIQKDSPDHFEDTLTSVCTDAPVTAQDKYDLLDFFDKSSIFYGGVVDSSRVSLLHSHAELAEHSILVSPGIYWTDNVKEVLLFLNLTRDKSTVNGFKVFIGLAVWGREQLEGEISSNYWMEVTLSEADCKRIAFTGRYNT